MYCGDVWMGVSNLERQVTIHWRKNPDRYSSYAAACSGYFYYLARLRSSELATKQFVDDLDLQTKLDQW